MMLPHPAHVNGLREIALLGFGLSTQSTNLRVAGRIIPRQLQQRRHSPAPVQEGSIIDIRRELPDQQAELLRQALQHLVGVIELDDMVLGGGTALASLRLDA